MNETQTELIGSLMDQIKFLLHQYNQCKRYIVTPVSEKDSVGEFIQKLIQQENDSHTLLYDLVGWLEKNPEMADLFINFYGNDRQN